MAGNRLYCFDMPTLHINLAKLDHNIRYLRDFLAGHGLSMLGAVKGCNAYPPIVRLFQEAGVSRVGMSRLEQIPGLAPEKPAEPVLLALPPQSQAVDVVRQFKSSLNSELETVKILAAAAETVNQRHGIILMVEVGDLREGVLPEELPALARACRDCCGDVLFIEGVGAQFSCMSGLLPNPYSLQRLVEAAGQVRDELGLPDMRVSVGGSDFIRWLERNDMPQGVDEVRVGFSILLGRYPDSDLPHPSLHNNALLLEAEVLEVRDKPSIPWGATGINAFGEKPLFVDKGVRTRAILDFGAIETEPRGLTCTEAGVTPVGYNSNYSVFDVADAPRTLKAGDRLTFRMNYKAMTLAFYSPLVRKAVFPPAM